jgi:RNA polymerase sigma-70 factor (ECF subfamily)
MKAASNASGTPAPELVRQLLENRDVLLAYICALTRDFDAAEEVFQEVAAAVLGEAGKSTDVVHFLPWAREVARRRVADYYRKQARRRVVEQPSGSMDEVVGQAFTEYERESESDNLRLQYLLECVQRLAGRSREVIEGYYGKRQSIRDIAAALGWGENSVKVALCRARKVLADCVQVKLRGGQAR